MEKIEEYILDIGDPCPKCGLGKGLREISPIRLGITGWESYRFLHCDICGASFAGQGVGFFYLKYYSSGS